MLSNESLFLLTELMQGGSGAFRVAEGEEAPLPGVEDLALRRERAANVYGAEALGFKKTRICSAAWVRATCWSSRARISPASTPRHFLGRGTIIVIGSVLPEARGQRVRRAADRKLLRRGGDGHQPARQGSALHPGAAGAGRNATQLAGARRSARSDGQAGQLLPAVGGLRTARRQQQILRRTELRDAWVQGLAGRRRAARDRRRRSPWVRRDRNAWYHGAAPGCGSATCPRSAAWRGSSSRREDADHLHDLHDRGRDADSGRAQDLGLDSGSSRTESRRQGGLASAGRRRPQEFHEGRDHARRASTSRCSCWRRSCLSFPR